MDWKHAKAWLRDLKERGIGEYTLEKVLGVGCSAAVFRARHPAHGACSIKVYDSEFIAKHGGVDAARLRLDREFALRGHGCPTLVDFLDRGDCFVDGRQTAFLAMAFVPGEDMGQLVKNHRRFTDGEVRACLRDLHHAASLLLERGLCHRDIKSDNMRLRDDGRFVLLDLGVVKSISMSDLTDRADGARSFISTVRYAPPELLHRRETDDRAGWTAVNLYQIGTVLWEMLMGRRFLGDVTEPPADLVEAVDRRTPWVFRSDVGRDLIDLTNNCLVKDPASRLRLVPWEAIPVIAGAQGAPPSTSLEASLRVESALASSQSAFREHVLEPKRRLEEQQRLTNEAHGLAEREVERVVRLRVAGIPGSRVESASSTLEKWWGIGLPENLEYGIVGAAGIAFRVLKEHSPAGCARVDGVAYRLSFGLRDTSLWLPAHHLLHRRGYHDVVFDGVASAARIAEEVDRFITDRLAAILEDGRVLHGERMAWEREKILAKMEKRRPAGKYEPVPAVCYLGLSRVQRFEGQPQVEPLIRP